MKSGGGRWEGRERKEGMSPGRRLECLKKKEKERRRSRDILDVVEHGGDGEGEGRTTGKPRELQVSLSLSQFLSSFASVPGDNHIRSLTLIYFL